MPKKRVLLLLVAMGGCALMAWGALWFIRARREASRYFCITALKSIDSAKQVWALNFNKTTNDVPAWNDLLGGNPPILGWGPECPNGGVYTLGPVGEHPTCSLGGPMHTLP